MLKMRKSQVNGKSEAVKGRFWRTSVNLIFLILLFRLNKNKGVKGAFLRNSQGFLNEKWTIIQKVLMGLLKLIVNFKTKSIFFKIGLLYFLRHSKWRLTVFEGI